MEGTAIAFRTAGWSSPSCPLAFERAEPAPRVCGWLTLRPARLPPGSLLQQTERQLRQLVGLSEHRETRLRQYLVARHLRRLGRHVDVADARVRGRQIQAHGRDVALRDLEAVHG